MSSYEDMDEMKIFELVGNLWDYERVADVCSSIGDEFLEKQGITGYDKQKLLLNFRVSIVNSECVEESYDLTPSHEFEGKSKPLFRLVYENSAPETYSLKYDEKGIFYVYPPHYVTEDFDIGNTPTLAFFQRPYLDSVRMMYPILTHLTSREVMRFIEEMCRKYNLQSELTFDDFPERLKNEGHIGTLEFTEDYFIGKGRVKVELARREEGVW